MTLKRRTRVALLCVGLAVCGGVAAFVWRETLRSWSARLDRPPPGTILTATHPEGTGTPDSVASLVLVPVASGFARPVDIQFVPGRPGTAIVLEKEGAARIVDLSAAGEEAPPSASPSGSLLEVEVRTESELGLLGLAFHPRYEESGRFFVNYNPSGDALVTIVSEWQLPLDEIGKQPAREVRRLLEIQQPYRNHDGGGLAFGPDGMLYIGMGDGGAANDPKGHGQNLSTLLGAMLRIDVDVPEGSGPAYRVPSDNPHVGKADVREEIWASGLRNPWRFSFDPRGRLLVADVGQNRFEEVDVVEAGDNLGWNVREAAHCFGTDACPTAGFRDPIFEYGRDLGTSITGGYVYTGSLVPSLRSRYVFGDFTSRRIWSLEVPEQRGESTTAQLHGQWPILISTFGRDSRGEIYVADHDTGEIFRLGAAPAPAQD